MNRLLLCIACAATAAASACGNIVEPQLPIAEKNARGDVPGATPTTPEGPGPSENPETPATPGDDEDPPPPGPEPAVTYYRDVQPLLERSCHGCHVPGGAGPFPLDTPEDAQGMAPAIVDALERGVMPPFHANQECNEMKDDTRFTAAEKELVRQWNDLGAPLGNPATAVHAPVVQLPSFTPTHAYDIGVDFDVAAAREDTNDYDIYRCFDVDLGFTTDTAITAYEVVPDNGALVHHFLAYAVHPNQLDDLQNNDDDDPGAGYACESAGPGVGGTITNLTVSWVPGAGALRMPEGTGIVVPAGSHLVVQIHYNLLAATGDTLDRTSFSVETAAPAGLDALNIVPVAHFGIDIPAGDPASVQTYTTGPFYAPVFQGTRVFAITGHMHQLGTRVRVDVLREGFGADEEECAFESTWDFNWQRSYALVEPLDIGPNDRLRLTCEFDNSAENQVFIDGVQQQPRRVQWGEGSLDEMCMAYLTFVYL